MAFFRKTAPATEPYSTLNRADTLPADTAGRITDQLAAKGNVMLDKAAQVYNRNPKLIGALAAVAGAIVLARMKRGRS